MLQKASRGSECISAVRLLPQRILYSNLPMQAGHDTPRDQHIHSFEFPPLGRTVASPKYSVSMSTEQERKACPECKRTFAASYLKRHLAIVHQGDKPHACSRCSRAFSQKAYLTKHVAYCGQSKDLTCSNCLRSFESKSDFILHRLSAEDDCRFAEVSPAVENPKHDHVPNGKSSEVLDPCCNNTFTSHEPLLQNRLLHCTSVRASSSIIGSKLLRASVPADERYDGFDATGASTPRPPTVNFEVRPASDGVLFPFSRYPKALPPGSPISILAIDASVLLSEDYSLFYVATTPTLFTQGFSTVQHTHVTAVRRDSPEERYAAVHLTPLDKNENRVFHVDPHDGLWNMSTKVTVSGRTFPHSVFVSFLGDLPLREASDLEVHTGTKYGFVNKRVSCPADNCTVTCTDVSNLKSHYLTKHVSASTFRCRECEQSFATSRMLIAHQRSHARLPCPKCEKSYVHKRSLILHLLNVHHRGTIETLPVSSTIEV